DFRQVLRHALHRALFDLDGFGKQERQHVGGLPQQVDTFLNQGCPLGQDVCFPVGEFFAHQVPVLQVWDQTVAEVFGVQFANVGAVDCDGFFLIEACRVGQHIVDVEVFDEFFGGENVFIGGE